MASSMSDIKLEEQLKEAGTMLLSPPSSIDELLNLLDKVECLLTNVEQAPSKSMQDALLPPMKALIATELLMHSDTDVRVSVASCMNEITRITAPDAPYNDEKMKEIFRLTVAAFEKLSHVSGRCYTKAVSILDTVAKVRSCLVMLDLECDELIVEMFQHFLRVIRSNHPHAVFSAMETIMTLVLDESEDISWDLLSILLACVKKENQNVSPISWKLGEKVITNSAAKLKPYLLEAVQSMGIALDDYTPVVASICRNGLDTPKLDHDNGSGCHLAEEHMTAKRAVSVEASQVTRGLSIKAVCPGEVFQAVDGISKQVSSNGTAPTRNNDTECCSLPEHSKSTDAKVNALPGSLDSMKEDKPDIAPETVPKKRGRRPNSLMNPEEGYDPWICSGRKTPKTPYLRIPQDRGGDSSLSENPVFGKAALQSRDGKGASSLSPNDESHPRRGLLKKKGVMMNPEADPKSLSLSKGVTLKAHVEEKAPQSADVKLKKELEERSNSKTKRRKRSTRVGFAAKTKEDIAQAPGHVISQKEDEVLSDSEEKQLKQSFTEVGARNVNEDRSSVQTEIRKRSLVNATPDKGSAAVSGDKTTTKSWGREGSYLEDTPKTKLKRKHTAEKGMASETPDIGEEMVGKRIKVWWPMDKTFYEGVVDSYNHIKRRHRVLYADGDEEVLNLRKQRWELIADDAPLNDGQEIDLPKPDASSDLRQKTKGKTKSESAEQGKAESSLKRNDTSASVSKIAEKSGDKSADMLDKPIIIVDKPMDDASRVYFSKDDGPKYIEKLETETLKTGIDSQQTTTEAVTPYKGKNLKGGSRPCGVGGPKGEYLDYLVEMNKGAKRGRKFNSPETNESVNRDK